MQEHIIPYVIDEAEKWWTGLSITNHSYNPTSILLDYFLINGNKMKSEEIFIPAGGMVSFVADVYYRAWVRIISDNNLSVTTLIGTLDGNTNTKFPPVYIAAEKRDVVVRDACNLNPGVVKIAETEFVRDCSQTNHYLTHGHWDIVQLIARWIHYKYPDRKAQKLEINDASTASGIAQGHPTGSHQCGLDCDYCYYTLGDSNHTQASSACREPIIPIDGALFDAERNVDLIIKLNEIFPEGKILSYEAYEDPLKAAAWRMYGDEMREKFGQNDFIQYDSDTSYNHHTHIHVSSKGPTGVYEKVNGGYSFGIR